MHEYTFISKTIRLEAKDYSEALSFCRDGKVPLDSEVLRRSRTGVQQFPLRFDRKLNDAASDAHGVYVPRQAPKSISLGISILCFVVCAGGAVAVTVHWTQEAECRNCLKALCGFALMLSYFGRAAFLELRFVSRHADAGFCKESSELHRLCSLGDEAGKCIQALKTRLELKNDSLGLDLRGPVRVCDFAGDLCDVRVTFRKQRLIRIRVAPKF